jgi:hypothetical protein
VFNLADGYDIFESRVFPQQAALSVAPRADRIGAPMAVGCSLPVDGTAEVKLFNGAAGRGISEYLSDLPIQCC